MELKVCIANKAKVNGEVKVADNEVIEKWVVFPIDEDEQRELFKELGIDSEDGYKVTDFEFDFDDFPIFDEEYKDIERLNEVVEKLIEWETEEDKFNAVCEVWSFDEAIENSPDDYILYSGIDDEEEFAERYIDEMCVDVGEVGDYIDLQRYGEDLVSGMDCGFSWYGLIEYCG